MAGLIGERHHISRARQIAFAAWAAILSAFFGLVFVAVTALSVGFWLTDPRYTATNPVVDLGFFALGALFIGSGVAVQLGSSVNRLAGLQQALIAVLALTAAGWIGDPIEPFVGGLVFLAAMGVLAVLHPARDEFFKFDGRVSLPLAALTLVGAIPAVAYAQSILSQARVAAPSCFLGRCATGDRFAEMAALAIAVVLVGLLTTVNPSRWRLAAWAAGASTVIVGLASIWLPDVAGSVGRGWGALALSWSVLFIIGAEWEVRRRASRS